MVLDLIVYRSFCYVISNLRSLTFTKLGGRFNRRQKYLNGFNQLPQIGSANNQRLKPSSTRWPLLPINRFRSSSVLLLFGADLWLQLFGSWTAGRNPWNSTRRRPVSHRQSPKTTDFQQLGAGARGMRRTSHQSWTILWMVHFRFEEKSLRQNIQNQWNWYEAILTHAFVV